MRVLECAKVSIFCKWLIFLIRERSTVQKEAGLVELKWVFKWMWMWINDNAQIPSRVKLSFGEIKESRSEDDGDQIGLWTDIDDLYRNNWMIDLYVYARAYSLLRFLRSKQGEKNFIHDRKRDKAGNEFCPAWIHTIRPLFFLGRELTVDALGFPFDLFSLMNYHHHRNRFCLMLIVL